MLVDAESGLGKEVGLLQPAGIGAPVGQYGPINW